MNLYNIPKNIIYTIGVILVAIVLVLNILYISKISNDLDEVIEISRFRALNIFISLFIAVAIYALSKLLGRLKIKKEDKIKYFCLIIAFYIFIQIMWINYVKVYPVADQRYVYDTAVSMYNGTNIEEFGHKYLELYPQQLTLASLWNVIFKVLHTTDYRVLQYINSIANAVTLVMIYLITKILSKKYDTNSKYPIIIYLCFLTIPALSTFVYGDEIGLALSMVAIYFVMKYTNNDKKYLCIISAIFMSFSYMVRMNNLIVFIAILIYLGLDLLKKKCHKKELLYKVLLIFGFIIIWVFPNQIIRSVLMNKYELNKNNSFPTMGFIYLGILDGERGAGWYDGYAAYYAWNSIETAKDEYTKLTKERANYLITHPNELVKFYGNKTASMWAENTYALFWYNQSFNSSYIDTEEDLQRDAKLREFQDIITIWQKAVIINIFLCTLVIIIQNREKIDNDVLLLLLVFIGGVLFHILWEAKSRYIIPYIIALIPLISINIRKSSKNNSQELKEN